MCLQRLLQGNRMAEHVIMVLTVIRVQVQGSTRAHVHVV